MNLKRHVIAVGFFAFLTCDRAIYLSAQQPDNSAVAKGVDASVRARIDTLESYTVTEHYTVFRGQKESNPAAEMTVQTVYRKGSGKNFTVLSQSGSSLLRTEVLGTLLDNEKRMSRPGNVETALIDSANYEMRLAPKPHQQLDGRECLVVELTPRRTSPFLFKGILWVDARDYAIVRLEGTAAKSPFFLASPSQVSRQYSIMSGLPMATHASAVSRSSLLGQTVVKIDYTGYQIEVRQKQ